MHQEKERQRFDYGVHQFLATSLDPQISVINAITMMQFLLHHHGLSLSYNLLPTETLS